MYNLCVKTQMFLERNENTVYSRTGSLIFHKEKSRQKGRHLFSIE